MALTHRGHSQDWNGAAGSLLELRDGCSGLIKWAGRGTSRISYTGEINIRHLGMRDEIILLGSIH